MSVFSLARNLLFQFTSLLCDFSYNTRNMATVPRKGGFQFRPAASLSTTTTATTATPQEKQQQPKAFGLPTAAKKLEQPPSATELSQKEAVATFEFSTQPLQLPSVRAKTNPTASPQKLPLEPEKAGTAPSTTAPKHDESTKPPKPDTSVAGGPSETEAPASPPKPTVNKRKRAVADDELEAEGTQDVVQTSPVKPKPAPTAVDTEHENEQESAAKKPKTENITAKAKAAAQAQAKPQKAKPKAKLNQDEYDTSDPFIAPEGEDEYANFASNVASAVVAAAAAAKPKAKAKATAAKPNGIHPKPTATTQKPKEKPVVNAFLTPEEEDEHLRSKAGAVIEDGGEAYENGDLMDEGDEGGEGDEGDEPGAPKSRKGRLSEEEKAAKAEKRQKEKEEKERKAKKEKEEKEAKRLKEKEEKAAQKQKEKEEKEAKKQKEKEEREAKKQKEKEEKEAKAAKRAEEKKERDAKKAAEKEEKERKAKEKAEAAAKKKAEAEAKEKERKAKEKKAKKEKDKDKDDGEGDEGDKEKDEKEEEEPEKEKEKPVKKERQQPKRKKREAKDEKEEETKEKPKAKKARVATAEEKAAKFPKPALDKAIEKGRAYMQTDDGQEFDPDKLLIDINNWPIGIELVNYIKEYLKVAAKKTSTVDGSMEIAELACVMNKAVAHFNEATKVKTAGDTTSDDLVWKTGTLNDSTALLLIGLNIADSQEKFYNIVKAALAKMASEQPE